MSEHYHALVWIDHQEARIFHFNAAEVERTSVRSSHPQQHLHHKANTRGSGHAPVEEGFLERVVQALGHAGAILITDPGAPARNWRRTSRACIRNWPCAFRALRPSITPATGSCWLWHAGFSGPTIACTPCHELQGCGSVLALALPPAAPAAAQSAAELISMTLAVTPDAEHGKILYLKHCARCHGGHAWGDGPREIPTLAGQRERYLIEQLARFSTSERPGSEMHGPAMFESLQVGVNVRRRWVIWQPGLRGLRAIHSRSAPRTSRAHTRAARASTSRSARRVTAVMAAAGRAARYPPSAGSITATCARSCAASRRG